MTKLFEIITPKVVSTAIFDFVDENNESHSRELKFNKLNLQKMSEMKAAGLDPIEIFSKERPFDEIMRDLLFVVFECMRDESKSEFNNSFDVFISIMDIGSLELFKPVFDKIMSISVPKSEAEALPSLPMKTEATISLET